MGNRILTLEEIEAMVSQQLDRLSKRGDAPYGEWLRCFELLILISQTRTLEHIAKRLDNGILVYAGSNEYYQRQID